MRLKCTSLVKGAKNHFHPSRIELRAFLRIGKAKAQHEADKAMFEVQSGVSNSGVSNPSFCMSEQSDDVSMGC